jgi:ankyrin repeat protein
MMKEDEDAAAWDDQDGAAKPGPIDGEVETESDALSLRKSEREEESDASNWGEKSAATSSDDEASRRNTTAAETKQSQQPRVTVEPGVEARFHAFSADDNDEDDDDAGNYQIVKKSIYKPHRKGFLSRLTGGAPVASTKKKYAPSDMTGILTGEEAEAENLSSKACDTDENVAVDLTIEEEEGIQVAIERSQTPRGAGAVRRDQRRLNAEDAALGGPSEVVIHSGDSEPGFATLNPIISSNVQRSTPTHGAFVAPAMTKSSGVPVAKASPVLLEIPAAEQPGQGRDRLLLIINALGATGLPKAEKFGTQSCLLEMRLFDSTDEGNVGAWSSYLMRTELHKKGGSEAQWNQQFTTTLRSKETQILHLEVKTSSKTLVGEANVALDEVGDLFYDQHYPLFRSEDNSDNGSDPVSLSAGHVHLQLKIVDTATMLMPTAVIPPLRLALFTNNSDSMQPRVTSPLSAKPIPAVLLNGGLFFKIPYHTHNLVGYASGPRRQWVAVRRETDPPHLQITWGDPTLSGSAERKSVRSLDLGLVTEIRAGHSTDAFTAQSESNAVKEIDKCFSLVTRSRTLDLVAASKEEARIWVSSLRELLFSSEKSADASLVSVRTIESYKQSALSPREQEESSGVKPAAAPAPTKRMIAVWRNRVFNLARHDRIDDILECLEDGCPIDLLESGSGDTLLMLACKLGNAELVELCLSRRAKNDPHPEFGETALQVAVNSSHAHCVGLLLSTAAKSDMDSEIVNHIDPNNDAPLHVAARHGDLACLQLLLHHGADICVVEEFGRTPLHCAVANGNLDCVAYLLDVGGDSVLNSGDHDGDTALHYAALSGSEAIVKLLLESAANVFATNVHKETAYDIAVREKQQRCAEFIAKYFITNEREVSVPLVTRNEPASTLLGRQRQEQATVVFRGSAALAKAAFEEDPPSASFIHPEVWKPGLDTVGHEDDYEAYSVKHRAASCTSTGSATNRLPLSPSEQVRDALTKKHRANSLSPREYAPPRLGPSFYSARGLQSYSPYASSRERLVATERLDRERIRPFPLYREADPRLVPREPWGYYPHESGYPQYGMQTQRQAPPEYAQPLPAFYVEARNARTVEMNTALQAEPATAWGQYNNFSTSSYSHQTLHPPRTESQWDTLYTEDGYPYYVNRITGVSQWEKPVEDSVSGGYATQAKPDASADSLAPDAIIRLRLAEVRQQKSQTALVSPASSCSTPTVVTQPSVARPAAQQSLEKPAKLDPPPLQETQGTPSSANSTQGAATTSEPSKYEARTGLTLAVDISAPPALDGTSTKHSLKNASAKLTVCETVSRPILVPSPRSRSPIKKLLEGADVDGPSGSFEKVCVDLIARTGGRSRVRLTFASLQCSLVPRPLVVGPRTFS